MNDEEIHSLEEVDEQEERDVTRFVFVTPVFNCEDSIVQTVLSVVAQSYPLWRMLIRDDMSTDGTVQRVTDLIEHLQAAGTIADGQIELTVNAEKHGETRNTWEAMKEIRDDEVVCRLDGGDWLTELDGLAMLDHAYRETNAGTIHTAHRWGFTNKNISGPLQSADADVYKHPWVTSHMKTFRAGLFRDIDPANFKDDNGDWIMNGCDRAVYLPILENARRKGYQRVFLPVCMLHYSIDTNDPGIYTTERAKKQKEMADFIHARGFIG